MTYKPLLLIIICINCYATSYAQSSKPTVVQIMAEEIITLNSRSNGQFGGKSRMAIPFSLPENTVAWCYAFSCSSDSGNQSLNLMRQVQLQVEQTNSHEINTAIIQLPNGAYNIQTYLLDIKNAYAFVERADQRKVESFDFISTGSRENTSHGVVLVKDAIRGKFYIGFDNLLPGNNVTVRVEAVAIVRDMSEWNEVGSTHLFEAFYNALKNNADENSAKTMAKCMVATIVSEKTPNEYDKMSQSIRGEYLKKVMAGCMGNR